LNQRLIATSRVVLPILLLSLSLACGREVPEDTSTSSSVVAGGELEELPVLGVMPYFELTGAGGQQVGLRELQGKVWIAGFIASSTPESTVQGSRLRGLQDELKSLPTGQQAALVSFTADPEIDTELQLAKFGVTAGADPGRWQLLTGPSQVLRRVAERFPVEDGDAGGLLLHEGTEVALVDRLGRIRGFYELRSDPSREELLGDLARVAAEIQPFPYPSDIMAPPWLEARQEAQIEAAKGFQVRHDFSFENRLAESGIRFVNQATEDSGKNYRTNHYDHGNGVVTADVDGDGLLDLYFLSQLGGNELWRNVGGGRFENMTDSAGVGLEDRVNVTAAFGDIDNDGDADLFVTTVRGGNVLFVNDGKGHFEDVSEQAGVAEVRHSSGAVFFDYDRDGLLDLFVTHVGRYTLDEKGPGDYFIGYQIAFDGHLKPERSERSTLFRNLGDHRFEDVSEATGLVENGWNGDAVVLDLNEDGWLDLFISDMQGHDEYWQNEGDKRFVNRSREVFPSTPFGSMGIQVMDFDNDGRMDLFLTDMHTDMVRRFAPEEEKLKLPVDEMMPSEKTGTDGNHVRGNAFFRNLGGGRFEEISDRIGAENYWPWGLSRGDLNADGFEDAFLASSMSYGWRYAANSLMLNEGGERFRDSEFVLGVEPRKDGINAIPWFDLDCSGEDREHFHCKGLEGAWQVWGALGSRSSLIWDLDDDGDLDIVTNDFNAEPLVLVSDLAQRHDIRSLKIQLVGTQSPRDAVGASVTVRAGGKSYRKVNDGNSGYLSFSRMPLYFGLGEVESVDSIEIRWPSGQIQTVPGPIETGETLTLTEP